MAKKKYLKCAKCEFENRVTANYCYKCGKKFTKKEKEEAYEGTLTGKIDTADTFLNKLDIRNHILFKIATVLVILASGFWYAIAYGLKFRILESNIYSIQYYEPAQEYYLLTDEDAIDVGLYIPGREQSVKVALVNQNNELISEKEISSEDSVRLNSNIEGHYYILTHGDEQLKVIVAREAKDGQ
ncbi:MAG: hypothetical protein Q4E47_01850 [Candidatus Saccharibacteria bacterium]|nr:hypothetical protein [Candidatus Saccharibacteria bacterium]